MTTTIKNEDFFYIIEGVLKTYATNMSAGARKSASRRISEQIGDFIREELGMNKSWNLAHDFPQHLELVVRRLEKGLGILLRRTPDSQKIYEFIAEEDKQGRKIETFTVWAVSPDRVQYLPKYFSKPEYLQVDYAQAFIVKQVSIKQQDLGERDL